MLHLFIVGKLHFFIVVVVGGGGCDDGVAISIIGGVDISVVIIDGSVRGINSSSSSGGVAIGVSSVVRVVIDALFAICVVIGVAVSTPVTTHVDMCVTIHVAVRSVRGGNGGNSYIGGVIIAIGVGVAVHVDICVGIAIHVFCFIKFCEVYCRSCVNSILRYFCHSIPV